ncbi:MAG: hypothetical protein COB30_021150 [Ectothiorhodospiraceae bacterium]|nr:hypothetical protein [Ectothiorhodospiraceae bacterium]
MTANGAVNPANSAQFSDANKCDFYKWASQMFLWLTSPGAEGYVFNSLGFFDISPSVNGQRFFITNPGPTAPGKMASNNNTYAVHSTKPRVPEVIGEFGQAGSTNGVLIPQAACSPTPCTSLVYYGVHVNNNYAVFATVLKEPLPVVPSFPTTTSVPARVFPKSTDTLMMELKTSWVDASIVNVADYLTINATVPKFIKVTDKKWTTSGTVTKKLALVGMHVVGTVKGHPEMVWATFEHKGNAPFDSYYYKNASDAVTKKPYSSAGNWTFMATNGTKASANIEMATVINDDIIATKGNTISASNTYIMNPWGSLPDSKNTKDVNNNTLIISLNHSVLKQLKSTDKRVNYIQTGAVWTDGTIPTFNNIPDTPLIGSTHLANSTLETYKQKDNCFSCHSINNQASAGVGISHIFDALQPGGRLP